MLDSPMDGPKWAPISRGGFCWKPSPDFQPRVMEIGAQFLETRWTRWCGKTPALFKEATNCMQESFVAIPVENKVELSMFVVPRVLYYVECC